LYLGPVVTTDMHPDLKELIDTVDVLFVPVGGSGVLETANAHKVSVSMEPHIIIPMCYDKKTCAEAVKMFEKESGGDVVVAGEKYTIKPKDVESHHQTVVSFR
jgi:L-ascorbate metabolism protein UlaG (beta-lactamase superfamily)